MYKSPSRLPEEARVRIADSLNARLADGLDLHSQIKVAHWNIKGPQFAALHPLFETFAVALATYNDEIAERAVSLGGVESLISLPVLTSQWGHSDAQLKAAGITRGMLRLSVGLEDVEDLIADLDQALG